MDEVVLECTLLKVSHSVVGKLQHMLAQLLRVYLPCPPLLLG